MMKGFAFAGAVIALGLAAAPAHAVVTVRVQETAENLKNLKTLLGSTANVTFTSELPGQAEADEMTAFGVTKKGERFIIPDGGFNPHKATLVKEVAYYDDAGLTRLSDLVGLYEDNLFKEAFAVVSDSAALPEPATWAMMVAGFAGLGGVIRRRRPRAA